MKKQGQKNLAQENDKLQKELQQLRAELAQAQQKLDTVSQEKPCSASATNSLDAPIVVMRHHIQVPLSQEPTSEALVRLARRKDDSISELRRGQLEVINVIFGNRDCLALMPTGGGKSLLWLLHNQLATEQIKKQSLTIVVAPFTATIDSHVAKTQRWGTVISSQESLQEMTQKINTASWLYTTPEKITHNVLLPWCDLLKSQAHRVTLVVYDEAHEWLNSWRAGICECVQTLHTMFPTCCRLACTATCRVGDSAMLINKLCMETDTKVERISIDRQNCYLHVKAMTTETADIESIFNTFLKKSAITQLPQVLLFVTSQDQAHRIEDMFKALCAPGMDSSLTTDMIASYHAATPREQKQGVLSAFVDGRIKLVVCTSAFGTGVDVPNVAVIIHYTLPPSITVYLQNVGRGGRNGTRYDCYLYFSYKLVHECAMVWFTSSFGDILKRRWCDYIEMVEYAMSMVCRRSKLLPYFDESYTHATCGTCDICLIMDDDAQMQLDISTCAKLILAVVKEFERIGEAGVVLSRVRDVILGLVPRGSNVNDKDHTLFGCGIKAGYTATNRHIWMMAGTYLLYGVNTPLLTETVTTSQQHRNLQRKVSLSASGNQFCSESEARVLIRYPIELMAYSIADARCCFEPPKKVAQTCEFDSCGKNIHARKLCHTHYMQQKRRASSATSQDLSSTPRPVSTPCDATSRNQSSVTSMQSATSNGDTPTIDLTASLPFCSQATDALGPCSFASANQTGESQDTLSSHADIRVVLPRVQASPVIMRDSGHEEDTSSSEDEMLLKRYRNAEEFSASLSKGQFYPEPGDVALFEPCDGLDPGR